MIIDRPESWYIFIFNTEYVNNSHNPGAYIKYKGKRLTNKEYLEHWGKWVFLRDKDVIYEMAGKLDQYVEDGTIPCIKYDRAPQEWFNLEQCVMCVYCDDRQRDDVWEILTGFGVREKAWTYEKEVIEKWLPGGLNLEKWIKTHNIPETEAEKIREDSREKFKRKIFSKPDELCSGWEQ